MNCWACKYPMQTEHRLDVSVAGDSQFAARICEGCAEFVTSLLTRLHDSSTGYQVPELEVLPEFSR
jgi:hypothetical protein